MKRLNRNLLISIGLWLAATLANVIHAASF